MRRIAVIFVVFFIAFLVVGCRNKGCGKNTGVKEYDLNNISFSDVNVIYDGEEHSVLLDGDLPEGLEVEYQNNKLKNVGTVSATATIKEKETQEVLKVLTANLSIDKRIVKVRVNDIYIKYGEEPKDDEYKLIEGSFVESDLEDLNLNVVISGKNNPMLEWTFSRFVIMFYDVVGLEYNSNSNYDIYVENGDATVNYSTLSLTDSVVYNNEDFYEGNFWEQEIISDFESYEQIISRVNEYDINNPSYVAPWVLEGVDEKDVTYEERITYGRYYEEHLFLTQDICNQYNLYANLKTEQDTIKDWYDLLSNNPDYDVWDWIEYRFGYTENEIFESYEYGDLDVLDKNSDRRRFIEIDKFQSVLDYLEYCCCDITYEDLVKILKSKKDYYEIRIAIKNTCKIVKDEYGESVDNRREFDKYYYVDSLCYLISKDTELYKDICRNDFDLNYYNSVTEEYNYFKSLYELVLERNKELKLFTFEEYIKTTLLGYGGLATDYPNKPLFTSIKENGNIVEFYFNYLDTTFKLVERDSNGDIISTTYYGYSESILKLYYQNSMNPSKNICVFSNEDESMSDTNEFNDKVTPNYSIYVEKDELGNGQKLIVSYTMEKRGIDYTYFPRYISKEKMDEYFERNKKLVEDGAVTPNGATIIDIKSDNKLYLEFCKTKQSYYKLVSVFDSNNKFGFDYYELSMKHSDMSGLVRETLYKCLYEYCGYTEQDLISDNETFNYKVDLSKPVFKIAIEYKMIDGVLYVSVPKSSIESDEESYIYSIAVLYEMKKIDN